MTMRIKIENHDAHRELIVTPYDDTGEREVAAQPVVILPGSSALLTVHELRSLHVVEGSRVRQVATSPADAAEPVAAEPGAAAAADAAGQA